MGPYIRDAAGSGHGGISLLAMSDQVLPWPGGKGGFKLMLNYVTGFVAQRAAAALGSQQLLWLLGETVTETGERHCDVLSAQTVVSSRY
jgi:branched-chain amino acid aminotransferase